MKLNEMMQQRYSAMLKQRDALVENWNEAIIDPMASEIEKQTGRELTDWDRGNIAMCLENALLESGATRRQALFEETTADDVSFLGIQLPVISALLPLTLAA